MRPARGKHTFHLAAAALWVALLTCQPCLALSWLNAAKQQTQPATPSDDDQKLGLSQAELELIFSGNSNLQQLERRRDGEEDCHAVAIGRLKRRCGDELDVDIGKRTAASILLTICDMKTARQNVPLECAEIQDNKQSDSPPSADGLAACVEALSRSAQFWSSYSGYLREVPQLCFALKRWHDIGESIMRNHILTIIVLSFFFAFHPDKAREIYSKIAQEKLTLLKSFKSQTRRQDENLARGETLLAKLAEQQEKESSSFKAAMQEHQSMSSQVWSQQEELSRRTAQVVSGLSAELAAAIKSSTNQLEEQLAHLASFRYREFSAELTQSLEHVSSKHSDDLYRLLLGALGPLEKSLSETLSQALAKLSDEAEKELASPREALQIFSQTVDEAAHSVDELLRSMTQMHAHQQVSTSSLLDVVAEHVSLLTSEADRWELLRQERVKTEAEWNSTRAFTKKMMVWDDGKHGRSVAGRALVLLGRMVGVSLSEHWFESEDNASLMPLERPLGGYSWLLQEVLYYGPISQLLPFVPVSIRAKAFFATLNVVVYSLWSLLAVVGHLFGATRWLLGQFTTLLLIVLTLSRWPKRIYTLVCQLGAHLNTAADARSLPAPARTMTSAAPVRRPSTRIHCPSAREPRAPY